MRVFLVLVMVLWAAKSGAATLEQEWAAWQKALASHGLVLAAEEAHPGGGRLLLKGVTIRTLDIPVFRTFSLDLPTLVLTWLPDGDVQAEPLGLLKARLVDDGLNAQIDMPSSSTLGRVERLEKGYRLHLSSRHQVVSLLMRWDQGYPTAPKSSLPFWRFGLDLTLDQMTLRWSDLRGVADIRNLWIKADQLDYDYHYETPAADVLGKGKARTLGPEISLNLKTPLFPNWRGTTPLAWLTEALGDGLDARLRWADQGSSVTQEDRTPAGLKRLEASYLSQSFKFGVSKGGMDLDFAMAGGAVQTSDPRSAPTEGHYTVGPVRTQVHVPLVGEGAQPFAVDLSIKDLGLPPEIEGQFDPEGRLPRGPLSLRIDLSGMIRNLNLAYLADPPAAIRLGQLPFAESLALREMSVSGFGSRAALTGNLTMEGLSQPNPIVQGQAEARLTGAHRMMDFLQSRGLISPDQNLGFRMMAASFFDPVDDQADELVSRIDARPDGSLYVNGARMR